MTDLQLQLYVCSCSRGGQLVDTQHAGFVPRDRMRSGADLNGDNMGISKAYLRISDRCRVTVRVGLRLGLPVAD